jgi:anti-sigma B factor antagonist
MQLRLVVEEGDGHALVTASGELDTSTAGLLRSAVRDALGSGYDAVLVHLAGVSFVDSSGITALLAGHRLARRSGRYFGVVAPSEQARRVMTMLGVEELPVHDTTVEAMRDR